MNLSEKLKYYRKLNNFTQEQVAKKLHVSRKTISGWENQHSTPDINSLVNLSDIYKISLDNLLRDTYLLQEYAEQTKQRNLSTKLSKITYYLNLLLIFLLYIQAYKPFRLHLILIPLFALINTIFFISNFSNWHIFKNHLYMFKTLVSFILLFITNTFVVLLISAFPKNLASLNSYYIFGLAMGKIALISLMTTCLTLSIFFKINVREKTKNSSSL